MSEPEQCLEPGLLLGHAFAPRSFSYTPRDVALYALGIGAAKDPLDAEELRYVFAAHPAGQRVFPTFAVLFARLWAPASGLPGLRYRLINGLHGEEHLELLRPLPTAGTVTCSGRITAVYDKGSGAAIVLEGTSVDEHGEPLARHERVAFVRGLGGFGGERGPSGDEHQPPDREPDAIHREAIPANQALLYQLSGDTNPIHLDPALARAGGYPRPILHGLCTYGHASRAVLARFGGNDPARFRSIRARFARPFFPGETLVTEMWREGERVIFRCRSAERGAVVLSHGAMAVG